MNRVALSLAAVGIDLFFALMISSVGVLALLVVGMFIPTAVANVFMRQAIFATGLVLPIVYFGYFYVVRKGRSPARTLTGL